MRIGLWTVIIAAAAAVGAGAPEPSQPVPEGMGRYTLDVHDFQVIKRFSGEINYYKVVDEPEGSFIQAVYRPPLDTTTLGIEVPEDLHKNAKRLRWRWRAHALPEHGDECADGKTDSAAVVYAQWKNGLKWYSLKFVWSTDGKTGAVCRRTRNLFVAMETVILRSGPPLQQWVSEEIDPSQEFRKHFRDGDPHGDVPDLVGIGILTDGDQTQSMSASDYAGFEILY